MEPESNREEKKQRKLSTASFFSSISNYNQDNEEDFPFSDDHPTHEDVFFKKVLPGLDCFAFMTPEGQLPQELANIDQNMFSEPPENLEVGDFLDLSERE